MIKRVIFYICIFETIVIGCLLSNFFYTQDKTLLFHRGLEKVEAQGFTYYQPIPNSQTKDYMFGEKTYTTNSDGIYSSKDYSLNKPSGTFRIVTLGDSFTFGSHVDTMNNWSSLLEKKLNMENLCESVIRFEVINLGVEGYDSKYSVQRYKDKGIKYSPDLVLWMHTDLIRQNEFMGSRISEKIKNGKSSQVAWEEARESLINEFGERKLYLFQEQIIMSLGKYYVGNLGYIYTSSINEEGEELLSSLAGNNENAFLIKIPELSSKGGEFPENVHPNEKGHQIIADTIHTNLLQNNIICNN